MIYFIRSIFRSQVDDLHFQLSFNISFSIHSRSCACAEHADGTFKYSR